MTVQILSERYLCEGASLGLDALHKAHREAAEGSAKLLERCNKLFRGFGRQYRVPADDARHILLNWEGYRA